MPGWGWLRFTLPPGSEGFWRFCGWRTVAPPVVLRLLTLLPPRAGWPALWRGWFCTLGLLLLLPGTGLLSGFTCCWRVAEPLLRFALPLELLPERPTWLPLRGAWLEELPEGRLCCMLRFWEEEGAERWLLPTEPSPFVLPDGPELRIWPDGADIEEEGRPPPLLRELPPPDPPRELLPPLV
jgi:hypothetical protein